MTGEWISIYYLTESNAGSDALAAKTFAILSEDSKYYILNGTKKFATNGELTNLFNIFAKIDGNKFTAFLVEKKL